MSGVPVLVLVFVRAIAGWLSAPPALEPDVTCEACHVEAGLYAQADTAVFEHARHVSVACDDCHVGLAALDARNWGWCDGCHHQAQPPEGCVRCHAEGPDPGVAYEVVMELPGGADPRALTFPHDGHAALSCASCHGEPPGAVAEPFECATCHQEHHEADALNCLGCHEPPPTWAHEDVVVHATCSGAICHKSFEIGALESWPRSVCEACHVDFRAAPALPEVPPRLRADTLP